ncbi:MAG: hypothetical protein EOP52_03120 [Sphingobacteriales bacterium]|nr:MAG: hypothetical protein EOP52_03120 [Sphingobacteriales bacterium]
MRYLLLPILAVVLAVLYGFLQKKNTLLSNRKAIFFVLLSALLIGLPGLIGFIGPYFTTGWFFGFQLLYLALGIVYVRALLRRISTRLTRYRLGIELLVSLGVLVLGMYVFSLLFNLLSPLKLGLWASTCTLPVLIPWLFHWSYQAFLDIPPEIYKVWHYEEAEQELDLEGLDFNRMMVLEVEFSRQATDEDLLKVKAKAPANVVYGDWFQKFINDYNSKFPANPVAYANEYGESYGWIFYIKPGFFRRRRFVDPDLSITENAIQEHKTIVCKRVRNQ